MPSVIRPGLHFLIDLFTTKQALLNPMNKFLLFRSRLFFVMIFLTGLSACTNRQTKISDLPKTNLTLPGGFSASIVADSIGPIRHIAINNEGDIYVKLNALKDGKGIYMLSDTDHDGRV